MLKKIGGISSLTSIDPVDVFDAALNRLNLKKNTSWIMDLGCSLHVSRNCGIFSTLVVQHNQAVIQIVGNQLLSIEGKGIVNFGF
jgi:hypothetical protein